MAEQNTKFSSQQIRGAILRAANRIEREPSNYYFSNTLTPFGEGDCGTRFCMLGWLGHELGSKAKLSHAVASEILGMGPQFVSNDHAMAFYDFCEAHNKTKGRPPHAHQYDAAAAADCLRAYADTNWPESAPVVSESHQLVRWSDCPWKPASSATTTLREILFRQAQLYRGITREQFDKDRPGILPRDQVSAQIERENDAEKVRS